jgi:hypothetical protein
VKPAIGSNYILYPLSIRMFMNSYSGITILLLDPFQSTLFYAEKGFSLQKRKMAVEEINPVKMLLKYD